MLRDAQRHQVELAAVAEQRADRTLDHAQLGHLVVQFVDCDEAEASVLKTAKNLKTYTVSYTLSMLLKVTAFNTATYSHT